MLTAVADRFGAFASIAYCINFMTLILTVSSCHVALRVHRPRLLLVNCQAWAYALVTGYFDLWPLDIKVVPRDTVATCNRCSLPYFNFQLYFVLFLSHVPNGTHRLPAISWPHDLDLWPSALECFPFTASRVSMHQVRCSYFKLHPFAPHNPSKRTVNLRQAVYGRVMWCGLYDTFLLRAFCGFVILTCDFELFKFSHPIIQRPPVITYGVFLGS